MSHVQKVEHDGFSNLISLNNYYYQSSRWSQYICPVVTEHYLQTDMKIRAWLSALLHDSKIVSGKGGEILLSVGMHLHSGSYELIGPLLAESVGIPITVSASEWLLC